jgi:hypothetical protein
MEPAALSTLCFLLSSLEFLQKLLVVLASSQLFKSLWRDDRFDLTRNVSLKVCLF